MTPLEWIGSYFLIGAIFAGLDLLLVERISLRGIIEETAILWLFAWPLMLLGFIGLASLIFVDEIRWRILRWWHR